LEIDDASSKFAVFIPEDSMADLDYFTVEGENVEVMKFMSQASWIMAAREEGYICIPSG
jgi:hypothetical protein